MFQAINDDCATHEPDSVRAIENTPECIEYYVEQLMCIYEDEELTKEEATQIITQMIQLSA